MYKFKIISLVLITLVITSCQDEQLPSVSKTDEYNDELIGTWIPVKQTRSYFVANGDIQFRDTLVEFQFTDTLTLNSERKYSINSADPINTIWQVSVPNSGNVSVSADPFLKLGSYNIASKNWTYLLYTLDNVSAGELVLASQERLRVFIHPDSLRNQTGNRVMEVLRFYRRE